jgi:energy-coupling factor transporter ATP-binding protein EcfA2
VSEDAPRRKGGLLVVVGPDGVGKSRLADALLEIAPPPVGYFHFRPPIRPPLSSRVPHDSPLPKNRQPAWAPVGWIRLAVAFVRFWLGYLGTVRPMVREGGLVVGDRWAYGYLAQPVPLRYRGPVWLARLAIGLLPSPDLVVNLVAPTEEIRRRKGELTEPEINEELQAWADLPASRVLTVDALQSPQDMAIQVLSELSL